MSGFTRLVSGLALISSLLISLDAAAGRKLNQDEILQLVREGKIRPLSELIAQNPKRLAGRLLDVDVEYEHGRLVYEIEVLRKDGKVREFYLNPLTGQVLKEELED